MTFTATLPANISSRAYGDGDVVKTLHYAVYEAGSDKVVFASDVAESPAANVVSNTQFTPDPSARQRQELRFHLLG